MNSGILKPETLRLGSRVSQPVDQNDPDAIELRALGRGFALPTLRLYRRRAEPAGVMK